MTSRWISPLLTVAIACTPCSNTIRRVIRSPNFKSTAVVFNRSCGATTPFLTHMSINPGRSTETSRAHAVFRATAKDGVARTDTAGGPLLNVFWRGDDTLYIQFDQRATVLTQRRERSGVVVIYGHLGA